MNLAGRKGDGNENLLIFVLSINYLYIHYKKQLSMTPRSFFTILLKLLGIYLLFQGILLLPQAVGSMFMYASYAEGGWGDALMVTLVIVLAVLIFLAILYGCIFKTDLIIDTFRLDRNFAEEKFELSIHRSTVLRIAVIVLGGVIFVDALPDLCRNVFSFFQMKDVTLMEYQNGGWMIFDFVKTLLGWFLMSNSRTAVNMIERQRKK